MTIDRKQVRLTGTANLSLAQNADVLWDVVDQEMSSRILEVLKSYQQNNPTTHPKCFAIISIVLARVNAVQGQMPTHIKTRKREPGSDSKMYQLKAGSSKRVCRTCFDPANDGGGQHRCR